MFKTGFILLLCFACVICNNATNITSKPSRSISISKHENAILINNNKCSGDLVLQEGNTWVLVNADFAVDLAKCWYGKYTKQTEFSWDNGIAKVSFPRYHTMLLFIENIDNSFAGLWNCLFLGQNVSQPVSCAIKVEVRAGTFQSASASILELVQSSKQCSEKWIWIGIFIGITIILITALAAVIIYYKRKVDQCVCESNDIGNDIRPGRPSLAIPEPMEEFENKPLSDRTSNVSDNVYEGVYNHDAGLMRPAPAIPQRGTKVINIKKPY